MAVTPPSTPPVSAKQSWSSAISAYLDSRAIIMLFLGFAAGIPIMLIFSSLSLWLREAGFERSVVTMFGLAGLGYSFKFIWAPLIDAVPLPILTKRLGRRRAWMLISQLLVISAICIMASVNPTAVSTIFFDSPLTLMAIGAVLLGFSSATQDIVIDAYRIELGPPDIQSVLSAMYSAGYRIGMIISGAGALYLADFFGSTEVLYSYEAWRNTYFTMAGIMSIAVATTLLIHEPINNQVRTIYKSTDYSRLVAVFIFAVTGFVMTFYYMGQMLPKVGGVLVSFLMEVARMGSSLAVALVIGYLLVNVGLANKQIAYKTWIEPVVDFFRRYGSKALLLIALIGLYRISDIVAGIISNVFYQDMGFSKTDIATAVKLVGVIMLIAGSFLGALLAKKLRIMQAMMVGAILAAVSNLLFVMLTYFPGNTYAMYTAVIFDNLAAGLAMTVFIAFLSALTSIRFTAVQYAIFSSIMTLIPKVFGGYSGAIVDNMGYPFFYTLTMLIGLPILILIYLVDKKIVIGRNDDIYDKAETEKPNLNK